MIEKHNILLFLLLFTFRSSAQGVFNNVYDYGLNLTESATQITEYHNNYYVSGGHNYGFGSNSATVLLKLNEAGQKIFYSKFDLSPKDDRIYVTVPKEDKIYGFGSLLDTTESVNKGYNSFMIAIDTASGDSTYFKDINFGFYDGISDAMAYKEGFLVLGLVYNNVGLDYNYSLVSYLDTLGNILNYQEFGDGMGYHFAYDFKRTDDGGIIIAGETNDYPMEDNHQLWLMKLDSNLNQLWYYEYGDTAIDESIRTFNYLEETGDGGFLLACEKSALSWTSFTSSLVYKIDSVGIEEWSQDLSYSESTYLSSIRKWNNGSFLVAGNVTNYSNPIPGFEDPRGYICKYTSDGQTLIWQRYFSKWWGNPFNHDYVHDMILSTDGGILVSGYQIHAMPTWNDAWLIKFDSCGFTTDNPTEALIVVDSIVNYTVYISNLSEDYCTGSYYIYNNGNLIDSIDVYAYSQWSNGINPNQMQYTFPDSGNHEISLVVIGGDSTDSYSVQFNISGIVSSISQTSIVDNLVKIYPNPAQDYIIVECSPSLWNAKIAEAKVGIYATTGQLIKVASLNTALYQQRLFVDELSNGVYLLNFTLDGKSIGNKRLSVVR